MDAREVRIGNIIASGEKFSELSLIGKVLEIGNPDREFEQIYCECDESFEWFFKGNYCGIPLTEEWLLKFGFTKVRYEKYAHSNLNKLRAFPHVFNNGFGVYIMGAYSLPNIKHVHQLQNLYYALTGEELTIK